MTGVIYLYLYQLRLYICISFALKTLTINTKNHIKLSLTVLDIKGAAQKAPYMRSSLRLLAFDSLQMLFRQLLSTCSLTVHTAACSLHSLTLRRDTYAPNRRLSVFGRLSVDTPPAGPKSATYRPSSPLPSHLIVGTGDRTGELLISHSGERVASS